MNDFFANLYELIYYSEGFSGDMYSESLYLPIGLTMLISALVWMVIYYYAINHPRFHKFWHWGLWVLLVGMINFGLGYYISSSGLDNMYFPITGELAPYDTELYIFSLINGIYAIFAAAIFSCLIKWGSTNCRKTPF